MPYEGFPYGGRDKDYASLTYRRSGRRRCVDRRVHMYMCIYLYLGYKRNVIGRRARDRDRRQRDRDRVSFDRSFDDPFLPSSKPLFGRDSSSRIYTSFQSSLRGSQNHPFVPNRHIIFDFTVFHFIIFYFAGNHF